MTPDLTAKSLIELFHLGTTTITKPGDRQIQVLCESENSDSIKAVELSIKRLELYDKKILLPKLMVLKKHSLQILVQMFSTI